MENYWIKWQDLSFKLNNEKKRKLVLFGRSEDWVPKALRKLKQFNPIICDSNIRYDKTRFEGINVFHKSKFLKNKDKEKFFFVITTGSYNSVIKELKRNNKLSGKDFVCLPDFYDFAFLDNLIASSIDSEFLTIELFSIEIIISSKIHCFSIRRDCC